MHYRDRDRRSWRSVSPQYAAGCSVASSLFSSGRELASFESAQDILLMRKRGGSVPGAAGMAGLAAAVRSFPDKLPPIVLALLTGLNASAVGLIALAAYQLSNGAVTDAVSRIVLVGCASFGICYHAPWVSAVSSEE